MHNSLIMTSVDTEDAPTDTHTTGETKEEPLESIWDSHTTKKTVEHITRK